jgi:hypothetical protein
LGAKKLPENKGVAPLTSEMGINMRKSGIAFLFGIALSSISPADAATYNLVNQGGGIPLTGYIITDGQLGTLSQSDIIAWQITETGTSSPNLIMTSIDNTNSTVSLTGSALSANSAGLLFNLAASGVSILSFTSNQTNSSGNPAFRLTFCDTAAACFYAASATLNISYRTELFLGFSSGGFTRQTRSTVTSPIATFVPTPLPTSLVLLLTGLTGIGGLSLRRHGRRGH